MEFLARSKTNVCDSFAYPTRPDALILRDLSFTVYPGETVAIVGFSGSGKSTIAQLLFRFYDPLSGDVFVDGSRLQDLDMNWLRADVLGLVPQEVIRFYSFAGSIVRLCHDNLARPLR